MNRRSQEFWPSGGAQADRWAHPLKKKEAAAPSFAEAYSSLLASFSPGKLMRTVAHSTSMLMMSSWFFIRRRVPEYLSGKSRPTADAIRCWFSLLFCTGPQFPGRWRKQWKNAVNKRPKLAESVEPDKTGENPSDCSSQSTDCHCVNVTVGHGGYLKLSVSVVIDVCKLGR